jgi:hypothetical protein
VLPRDLIDALRSRADDRRRFVDAPELVEFRRFPPATPQQIEHAEGRVGFSRPAALRTVYLEVANGGFGPGYGLVGVDDGATDDQGDNLEQLYRHLSAPDPDVPGWTWPEHTVAFCYWGCQVYSCATPDGSVLDLDGYDWRDTATPLVEWLSRWADGHSPHP